MTKHKKVQEALAVFIILLSIIALSSIISIEQEKAMDNGMKAVSGMAVLDLDSIAGYEREIISNAKDGNYYLLRKKGDEWYYGDTTVKVSAENMNSEFDYYKVSEIPNNIIIKVGAPYEKFNELPSEMSGVTGMATGMEGVSGMEVLTVTNQLKENQIYYWNFPENGWQTDEWIGTDKEYEYYKKIIIKEGTCYSEQKASATGKIYFGYEPDMEKIHKAVWKFKENTYEKTLDDSPADKIKGYFKTCFLPSTPITLPNGNKKQIQNIKKGDKVLSYDLKNKKPVVSEVLNVFSHEENEYLIVNDKIKVTPYHNMFINGEWKQIGDASIGDYLMDDDGNEVLIESIEEVYDSDGVMVYDLEIKDYHYYFAEGVLVHNSEGKKIEWVQGKVVGTEEIEFIMTDVPGVFSFEGENVLKFGDSGTFYMNSEGLMVTEDGSKYISNKDNSKTTTDKEDAFPLVYSSVISGPYKAGILPDPPEIASCFLPTTPTTPITLPNGNKKQIQNIKVGDKVLSYDFENKKPVVSEVLNVFSHEENEYLIINGEIKVTPYHYVYAKRKDKE